MRAGQNPGQDRGRLALAWRRARLGVLMIWRARRLPAEEQVARAERAADRRRALEEWRRAAEEYHWAVAAERWQPGVDRPDEAPVGGAAAGQAPAAGTGR